MRESIKLILGLMAGLTVGFVIGFAAVQIVKAQVGAPGPREPLPERIDPCEEMKRAVPEGTAKGKWRETNGPKTMDLNWVI